MTLSAMTGMSRAIRLEIAKHARTLQELDDDVLRDYVEIVGAFYLDLEAEKKAREAA